MAGCLIGLLVVIALIGGAIFWFVSSLYSPRHQVAARIGDYQDLCAGRPIPGAAAYTPGSGSHPIAVFGPDQNKDGAGRGSEIMFDAAARDAGFNPSDPATVQLVACSDRIEDGPEVTSCGYQGTYAPMHRATVEITVYEARTAEQVGEPIEVVGEDTECPFVISYRGSPAVFSAPTPEQYRSVLAPFVSG